MRADSGLAPADTERQPRSRWAAAIAPWGIWAGATLVVALTVAVFLPALRNGFVNFDDADNFLSNPLYRGLAWEQIYWMFSSAHMGHYVPLTWLTLGLDYVVWGMNPLGYHLTALVLHTINAVLFYVLAVRLIEWAFAPSPDPGPVGRGAEPSADRVVGATVAALLFSVHPLRVESVAWITERRDLVCGLFSLSAVLAYVTAHRRGTSGRLQVRWYVSSLAFFTLALLSKSIVVGLPLILLALDCYPLRRLSPGAPGRHLGRLLLEKAPFLVLSAALTAFMLVLGVRRELMSTLGALGLAERLAVSSSGLLFYLGKTLIPTALSPFYELHYPVLPLSPRYVGGALTVLAITMGLFLARRRWPAGLTAWLAYVVFLLPVVGIAQNGMQAAADRYTYLACLSWALVAGGGAAWTAQAARTGAIGLRLGRLVIALAAAGIVALSALTTLQVRVWRDSEALWRHALTLDPRSAHAHYSLGAALWAAGEPEEARSEIEQALALLPDRLANAKAVYHAALGLMMQQQGNLAGAEQHYRAALAFSEDNVLALNNLGVIYAMRGDARAALDSFLRVLRVLPEHRSACTNGRRLAAALRVESVELKRCWRSAAGS
jgi:protein O-mannosyl-transferase